MSSLSPEAPGPGFIGQVLDDDGATVGTCWLVAPGWVLTAAHVAQAAGADVVAASVAAERAFSAAAARADERAVTLRLKRGLAETGPVIEGRVRRADTVIDLALVEIDGAAWASPPAELADSTGLEGKTVVVTGMAELADAREDAALIASSTTGSWDGWGLFNDSLYLPKIKASGALPNMSGAPVLRAGVSTVLGLVRSRYNSADGWGRDIVWVVGSRAIEQFCRPLIGPLLPPPPAPTQAVHVVLRPTRETVSLVCEELDTRVVEPCRGARSRLFPASERLRLARRGLVEARRSGEQISGESEEESPAMVLALLCHYGHINPPHGSSCRLCGAPIGGEPNWYPRPALGEIYVSTGLRVPIDADIIIGRKPTSTPESGRPHAHLVPVPSPDQQISRTHCEVRVDGWDVRLVDRNSNNGTYVLRPGERPIRIRPTEPFFVRVGDVIDIGEGVTIQMLGPQAGV